ncbi:MAG TPA: transcription elongation factor GreA [Candidatus Limnocylindrales bacterium]|nr:transcription elongation factor GreA [Candidatus Limnocylindrales bacterium]
MTRTAASLLRSVGLLADGPSLWGRPIESAAPGVFLVELPAPLPTAPLDLAAIGRWLERVPTLALDGARPTGKQLAARLASFWIPSQTVLLVGWSTGPLGPRLASIARTELGYSAPDPTGHWLKALRVLPALRVWWAETDAPEEYADALLGEFAAGLEPAEAARLAATGPILPWATLETVTGEAKRHGLSDPLARPPARTVPEPSVAGRSPAPEGRSRAARTTTPEGRSGAARSTRARPAGTAKSPARAAPPAPRAEVADRPVLSAEGLARLRAELEELRTRRRPEVIARVRAARELGDLRENAEYQAAREEQSFVEGRIQSLEALLRRAVVAEAAPGERVVMGSTVVVDADGVRRELAIVGSAEADPAAGRISYASPVGRALLGRVAGDEVTVPTPGGEARYRILEVR